MTQPPANPRDAGFSLIEGMASMAILAFCLLGIAQVQAAAASQNGAGRRVATAAAIARDFVETAQRWDFDDPRLAGRGCGVDVAVDFPLTETLLGNKKAPLVALDYTATGGSAVGGIPAIGSSNDASAQAETAGALSLDGGKYDGLAAKVLAESPSTYQLLWSVRDINPADPTATTGCSAKFLQVAVRYQLGNDHFGNVLTTTMVYDSAQITVGGLPERI